MSNDQMDDFDQDFADATVQRPAGTAKPGVAGNLAAAWQGSPLFKMFVLVVIVGALAAAAIAIFSGGEKDINRASVREAPAISATPGEGASPAYVDAVNDASVKRAENALQQGTSALPTPVSGDETKTGLGDVADESVYDPLAEFRPNTPQDLPPTPQQDAVVVDQFDAEALSKMQSQMTSLFESWRPSGIKLVQIQDPSTTSLGKPAVETNPSAQQVSAGKVIVPAGTVNYGELLMEANSDAPGPVLAQILSGPFAGGRAIGQFEVTREFLIIRFTKINYKKKDYSVDILAVDPNTTLGGMVTEKDNRYLTRVVLPTAAAFLEGFGSALSTRSNSIVSNGNQTLVIEQSQQGVEDGIYEGISEGARTIGSFLREEGAATKPLIRVAVGTPMGLFFINSVTDGAQDNVIQTPLSYPQQPNTQPNGQGSPTPGPMIDRNSQLNNGLTVIPSSGLANSGISIIQSPTR